MVHSDWDDWLIRAVEDADPDGVGIWYLGCNGFILKGSAGTTLFIDPYLGTGDPPRTVRMVPVPFDPDDVREADAVLATHEHTDHVHGPSQAPILGGTGASFYATDSGIAVTREESWLDEWAVTDDQLEEIEEGDTLEIGEFTVHVEPANDPDAEHPISYVIEHEAGTFFHGGDARPGDFAPVGEDYDIDLGVLAFGTVGRIPDKETREPKLTKWYNDENMIIEAANELQLDALVPTHWDMWKGLTADPTALHEHARSFDYPESLEVVEIGDRIDL
ncbi:MBL fold metallo-hydrolase [Haloarculaceae archaeon H-GB2-1]|nr:MBL fold metallo-hydrolase [Haloarculaceae archaeon H-GB1-1]MEA5386230.1 MBL fold metallo-hydrolase [Haloarculaceae archaeon H-GB11]MEA5407731.1 MBL fold metallo-hydrolase [Haloarculaceae archaeon H-GB2-1]